MKRTSVSHLNNGMARALDVIGEWWTPLIIGGIMVGHNRYEALQSDLGIARNILSDRLSWLVDKGVLEKVEYSQRPKRYEYHLTDMGRDLYATIASIKAWGDKWLMDGRPSLNTFHDDCGATFSPVLVCDACNKPLNIDTVTLRKGPGWSGNTGYDNAPKVISS
jgi:hypothetical protein